MTFDASLGTIILAGALAGFACWALLYGVVVLTTGRDARVRARVKQFIVEEGQPATNPAQESRQLRENLFSRIDMRWRDQSALRGLFAQVSADLEKADVHLTVSELLLIQLGVSAGTGLVMWLLIPVYKPVMGLVGFALGLLVTRYYLRYLAKRRLARFEDQLPDTLSILASSVRGGFSLFQALQLIATEAPEPSKTEFMRVIHEVSLGANTEDALAGLGRRIPTEDVDILITAITLQHQIGGNLSHVLEVVATTVRERHRVEREIKSLTAQQRFSAILLAALPYLLAGVIFIISPAYIAHLFAWGWVLCMPVGAIVLSAVGLYLMRRIASIDV